MNSYGYVYSILFQLWLDEISRSRHFDDLLDSSVYERMEKSYSDMNGGICPPLQSFSILADDAFVILDVAAAIHCNELGEFNDVNVKRKEMIKAAQSGNFFCKKPRKIELVSEDLDLTFIMTIFNSFEEVGNDLSDLSNFPIVDFDIHETQIH